MSDSIQIPAPMLAAIELSLNRYLAMDPDTMARMAILAGKVIAIHLRGLNTIFYLIPHLNGVGVSSTYSGQADTVLCGTPGAFMRLGASSRPASVLFSGDVEISGDVELGQAFKKILDTVEIDWEEQLSKVFGDVVAHGIGNVVRDTTRWLYGAAETLGMDLAEYLHEETHMLPQDFEIEAFLSDVDTLRSDTDRLEQRVVRLLHRLRGGDS